MPADVLRRRPDIRSAERRLAAQTAQVGVATAALYPSLSLSGSIGAAVACTASDLFSDGLQTIGYGLTLSMPIFRGGALRQNIKAQNALVDQALATYEATVLAALRGGRERAHRVGRTSSGATRRWSMRRRARGSRSELALVQYNSGLVDFQTVLTADRQLISLEDSLAVSDGETDLQSDPTLQGARRRLVGVSACATTAAPALASDDRNSWIPRTEHRSRDVARTLGDYGARACALEALDQVGRARASSCIAALYFFFGRGGAAATSYVTQEVTRGDLTVTVTATGNLEPRNQVDIGSELSGTMRTVNVDVNDEVKAGQVLAVLDTTRLNAQVLQARSSLASAEARVLQSEASVKEARANYQRLLKVRELSGNKMPSQQDHGCRRSGGRAQPRVNGCSAKAAVAQARASLEAVRTDLARRRSARRSMASCWCVRSSRDRPWRRRCRRRCCSRWPKI